MQTARPSSPTKMPSLSAPKATHSLWTARLVATLWKLAVKRARKLRRQSPGAADIMFGSDFDTSTSTSFDETSIMHEAALSVVASGVVSLADLEAVTGLRLSTTHDTEAFTMKDDDVHSEAATDISDACSIADSDVSDNDEATTPFKESKFLQPLQHSSSAKSGKWVCVGYGRYVKAQDRAA